MIFSNLMPAAIAASKFMQITPAWWMLGTRRVHSNTEAISEIRRSPVGHSRSNLKAFSLVLVALTTSLFRHHFRGMLLGFVDIQAPYEICNCDLLCQINDFSNPWHGEKHHSRISSKIILNTTNSAEFHSGEIKGC